MKTDDFNILEQCKKLRRVQRPPYACPIEECGKTYQGFCGIQYHLVHANHPLDTLKEYFDGLPSISTTTTPMKAHHRKRGRLSRLPESAPVVVQSADSADETISEESKYLVNFEINHKNYQVNIRTPLQIIAKEDYEAKYGDLKDESNCANNAGSRAHDVRSKLPVASYREISSYDISDAPSLPNSYIRFIEKSAEELDGEVEYDMDEEDSAWLEIMNESRGKNDLPAVSMESFELLMDRLEKESYFLVQMNKEVDSSLAVIDDEAVCSICLDGECQNSNVILFCDMCNLAVHQDCYGVPYIPEGHWLCRRCLHSPSAPVDCVLCPNNGGAFKQTDRAHWAHVVCALWIPEVRFANTVFLEPIDSIESIPAARWRLTCYICKQRGVGACIQCHKTNCYSAFHVTCAQQAGLHMKMETVRDNNLVQKIAYCDTHAPPDTETKVRFKVKKEASVSPTDKMKTARRVLAKKRSVAPVISIPTIPPERIQEIAALINVPKKAHFIQRLIAYWTLKRQFRNGVPLLRRLQTSHLARRDESKNAEQVTDIGELYRQLKYWQSLRQDLERARLLCELVRKREKFKKELIKVKQEYVEMALCPFNAFLLKVIHLIRQKDTGEIFIEPVDQNEVPDYGDIVKQPMDLQTMSDKVRAFEYPSLEALEDDFHLMISNCLAYNAKHTIFYKSGLRMKEQGGAIIRQAKKDLLANKFDASTGLLVGQPSFRELPDSEIPTETTPVEEVQAVEIDKELAAIADPNNRMDDNELMCKLLQLLDKSEMLKNSRARMKRVKLVKIQMASIKRKKTLQKKSLTPGRRFAANKGENSFEESKMDESVDESEKMNVLVTDETILGRGRRKRKEAIPTNEYEMVAKKKETSTPSPSKSPFHSSPIVFKRPASALTTPSPEKSSSVIIKRRRTRKLTGGPITPRTKAVIPNSESFRIYRSSNETPPESDDESNSEDSSSSSSCSCSETDSDGDTSSSSSSENESNDEDGSDNNEDSDDDDDDEDDGDRDADADDNSDSDDVQMEERTKIYAKKVVAEKPTKSNKSGLAVDQLQLVWAKCRGFPWYPALIINPDMPKGYVHNGVEIPSPPDDILALARNFSEPVYLVWFYDAKRSWQWLPRGKLKPLGVHDELDKLKLAEARKPADRKAVRKAYLEASVHKTK